MFSLVIDLLQEELDLKCNSFDVMFFKLSVVENLPVCLKALKPELTHSSKPLRPGLNLFLFFSI